MELGRKITKVNLKKRIEICSRQEVLLEKNTITDNCPSAANADK